MSRTTVATAPGSRPPPEDDSALSGRPKGLLTLSGLEVWERFSFLGMQAILVLCLADTVAHGGLGMSAGTAASVSAASVSAAYGTLGYLVYLGSVAGGRLADRILGSYRAVLWGGVLIACGHCSMTVPPAATTWVGVGLISTGTGLFKPNVATMVGKLYTTDDDRRDAGFALHYTAISTGAFAGPLITGRLGEHQGRHQGFSAAAIGMTFGLIQYVMGRRHLAGRKHTAEFALAPDSMRRAVRLLVAGIAATAVTATGFAAAGRLTMDRFVDLLTLVSVTAPAVCFAVMFTSPRMTAGERGRLRPYLVLFLASTAFNFILFQAYSTMMQPAASNAETALLGFGFAAVWYASALGAFEVGLALVVAALRVRTGRGRPHASDKIAIGVVLGGLSFLLMLLPTSGHALDDHLMSAWWIVGSYLLLGLGGILLETSGRSATTKRAPAAFSSQTMSLRFLSLRFLSLRFLSLRFLSLALADGVQARTVKLYDAVSRPAHFGVNGAIAVTAGPAVMAAALWLRRTMHPVH